MLWVSITALGALIAFFFIVWLVANAIFKNSPEQHARDVAVRKLAAHWTRRGDSWITHKPNSGGNFDPWDFTEVKQLVSKVTSNNVSEADRLNGVQWRGTVAFTASGLRRHYKLSGGFPPRQEGWTVWDKSRGVNDQGFTFTTRPTPVIEMNVVKVNGEWVVAAASGVEEWQVAPDPSSIPK